jgi:hypothetical protein
MADIGAWWESLSPATQQALILTASKTGAAAIDAHAQGQQAENARRDSAINNEATGIQSLIGADANDYQFTQNRDARAHEQAGQMVGRDPGEFQRKRAGAAAMMDILGGAGRHNLAPQLPGNIGKTMPQGSSGAAMTPFTSALKFGPSAESEGDFYNARANIDPSLKSPDLGAVGYGDAGRKVTNDLESQRQQRQAVRQSEDAAYKTAADARKEALMASLGRLGPDGTDAQKAEQDKGFNWKKWGTLAAMGGAGAYLGSR